jgi:CubicO group peptidase (beta-lactamase class C family)
MGPPWPPPPFGPDEWMARLGRLPLVHQPGEGWLYNTGSQVVGVLLERAAGMPLEDVLRDRLLEPLGMRDTGFSVPPDELGRFTAAYVADPAGGAPALLDPPDGWWAAAPLLPNLAGGLVSTVDDYWAFVRMLLAGGEAGGRRLLSSASLRLLLTDQLTDVQRAQGAGILRGRGWSLGCSTPPAGAAGLVGWDGGTGCSWRSDPDRGITSILLTQRLMDSPEPLPVYRSAWRAAFGE